ncbi:unnamed protein product [Ostreobium quekettii]|uniref:FCP1 homology domain-containing protein n=1 Tax=Ostreobium quekettii TaxID=121088 RepID=A0A8S1J4Z0_9CHLO|nr:unnamed protein product [Ostreobium quekettii]|eukprot:evm.model.scf_558EXC.4 EVM.evm.TU.scf_558EXC.4   scf_558EXC:29693-32722(+)
MNRTPSASIRPCPAPVQGGAGLIASRTASPRGAEPTESGEWDARRELRSVQGPRKRRRSPEKVRVELGGRQDKKRNRLRELQPLQTLCQGAGEGASALEVDVDQYTGPVVLTPEEDGILPGEIRVIPSGEADAELQEYLVQDYMQQFAVIRSLPSLESLVDKWRLPILPMPLRSFSQRQTLVLDLDETLVHSWINEGDHEHDLMFKVSLVTPDDTAVFVRLRPHLLYFLEHVSKWFEVVVFTASQKAYADKLLTILDPGRRFFKHRVFRESCVELMGMYFKDLTLLGRDLARTVIVDNQPQVFGLQVDNGIPIASFYDNRDDTELLKLLTFLQKMMNTADVRPLLQEKFGLRRMIHG